MFFHAMLFAVAGATVEAVSAKIKLGDCTLENVQATNKISTSAGCEIEGIAPLAERLVAVEDQLALLMPLLPSSSPTTSPSGSPSTSPSTSHLDPVFQQDAVVTTGGNSCLYNSEGQAADLPMAGESYKIEFWMKGTSTGDSRGGFVYWGNAATRGCNAIRRGDAYEEVIVYWFDAGTATGVYAVSEFDISDDTWHHIAHTWNHNTGLLSIYVDFKLETSATDNVGPENLNNKANFCVGKTHVGAEVFTGQMAGVRIYNGESSAPTETNAAPRPA
jgi:hypothetical protein